MVPRRAHPPLQTTERHHRQQEVDKDTGTERDEQKNTETSDFAISHKSRLKLAEN